MSTITLYPLGNADTYRIDLPGGEKLLFDYANVRKAEDKTDKRAQLPDELRADLAMAKRTAYDVVAFTHLDDDHVCGATRFFNLDHASKYQGKVDGKDRITITELWVPAWAITETKSKLGEDGQAIQAEARHRLKQGKGIRVFSRPAALKTWVEAQGITLASRAHLITDAGLYVPGWERGNAKKLELFVHSPFAHRQNDGSYDDRNTNCLVFQATFRDGVGETRALLMGDTEFPCIEDFVRLTITHGNVNHLKWDIAKLPHHSSYNSLGPEKGATETKPAALVAELYETHGQSGARLISSSRSVPSDDRDNQPPTRQAVAYYKRVANNKRGEYKITMEHPSAAAPGPMVIEITTNGAMIRKPSGSIGGAAVSNAAPRAG
jgi:hypothetical protein